MRDNVYTETKRFITMDEVDKGLKKRDKRKSAFIRKNSRKRRGYDERH